MWKRVKEKLVKSKERKLSTFDQRKINCIFANNWKIETKAYLHNNTFNTQSWHGIKYFDCQIIQQLKSILQTNIIITFISVIITSIKTSMETACVVVDVNHNTNVVIPLHQRFCSVSIFNFQANCSVHLFHQDMHCM